MSKMESSIQKKFAKYVSLNIIGMIGASCYILADTYFIANGIGPDGLTALNLAIAVFSFMQAIGLMIGIGSGTRFGICAAQGDTEKGNRTFTAAIKLGLSIGIALAIVGQLFSKEIAQVVGADKVTLEMTSVYLKTVLSFAPFFIVNNIVLVFARNDKNPRIATIGMMAGNFANIILDYIFIYPMHMSMFGAAFATGIAPIVSLLCLSTHFLQKKNTFKLVKCKVSTKKIKDFCSLGSSSFVNEIATSVSLLAFNLILLNLSGNIAVAAFGVIANLAIVAVAFFTGIAQGIQPLVSEFYATMNKENLRKILKYSVVLAVSFATVIYIFVFFYNDVIVNLFNKEDNIMLMEIAESGLRVYFIAFFIGGINVVMAGYLCSMEKANQGFLISLLRGVVILVPAAIILSRIFGVLGVWLAVPVTELLTFLVTLYFMKKNKATVS
ncbi:MAG: MATE family efflux transporter [Anaerovoracaceae bacterium]